MGAPVVVLVLPLPQLRGTLRHRPQRRPSLELLLVGSVVDLPVSFRTAGGGNVAVGRARAGWPLATAAVSRFTSS